QLEEFVTKVQRNLASADWQMKREMIRALVRRVEIDKQEVTVVFRVGPDLSGQSPEKKSSQHCWRREHCPLGAPDLRREEGVSLQHPRVQPFPDQAQNTPVLDPALE